MLKLTDGAAKVLTNARADLGAPDTHGVRFYTPGEDAAQGGQARLAFDFVAEPSEHDAVDEVSGLKTYVAPEVNDIVGDATIDVEQSGDQARLVLHPTRTDGAAS